MSRIGREPIDIPNGVEVELRNDDDVVYVKVKGTKGTLEQKFPGGMLVRQEGSKLIVDRPSDNRRHKELHGLTRTLIYNMVYGVSKGYEKQLEIVGVGYKVVKQGNKIVLSLGYSHPIEVEPPEGIAFDVVDANNIVVKGIDKPLVGKVADNIKRKRKPDAYKGKGIRDKGQKIKLKAGKTGKK